MYESVFFVILLKQVSYLCDMEGFGFRSLFEGVMTLA